MWDQVQGLLGVGGETEGIGALATALRTVVIYVFSLAIIRIGSKRFLSQASAFDVVVGIMLGSVMSRAIGGSASLLPTFASGAVLIGMHWLLAALAFRFDWLGPYVKGHPVLLIEDGDIQPQGMRSAGVSDQDLDQALRIRTGHTDPAKVRLAYLERNGAISVVPAKRGPRVLEVAAAGGVQTIRIELE